MTNEELTQLAKLYYLGGLTQEDLARRFGISRATIGRLLKRAQAEGIVEIRVRHDPEATASLQQALLQEFGLQRVLISPDHDNPDSQRALLAGQVAGYLDRVLADNGTVAVGMGRNVAAVSRHVVSSGPRRCHFVCAVGGAHRGEEMNADHVARRLAAHFGGVAETLYAPAMVADPQLREALLENETVRRCLQRARRADLALVGIGDILHDSYMCRMGWFSAEELASARAEGAIGDLMGYDFIGLHGRPVSPQFGGRAVGLGLADLRRIGNVVAVASEPTKVSGVLGALRTGAIDTLAVTRAIAQSVLGLARATTAGG